MTAFVGVFRAGGPTEADLSRLRAAARALGCGPAPAPFGRGAVVVGEGPRTPVPAGAARDDAPVAVLARPLGGAACYVARGDDGAVGFASASGAAVDAAGRPRRPDPAGVAGWLWRSRFRWPSST